MKPKHMKTYNAWRSARQRCVNSKNPSYHRYGGRGITMCAKWLNDYKAFLEDMGECPDNLTLDRINNDSNYEPGNCRWATLSQQALNQRIKKTNKSGIKGVSYRERDKRWRAYALKRSALLLYYGDDFFEACCARKSWEADYDNRQTAGR